MGFFLHFSRLIIFFSFSKSHRRPCLSLLSLEARSTYLCSFFNSNWKITTETWWQAQALWDILWLLLWCNNSKVFCLGLRGTPTHTHKNSIFFWGNMFIHFLCIQTKSWIFFFFFNFRMFLGSFTTFYFLSLYSTFCCLENVLQDLVKLVYKVSSFPMYDFSCIHPNGQHWFLCCFDQGKLCFWLLRKLVGNYFLFVYWSNKNFDLKKKT